MHATKDVKRGLAGTAEVLQRIDEVLRLSRSAVWEVDLDGTFTYVSASFEDLLGYRPEELVGRRTIHDFYAPDMPEDLRAALSPEWIANGEKFTEMAIPLVAKSGEIVWIFSSGTPIRDAEGRITGSRGVDTDITALKRAEENVRATERALWRQMQETPVPMAFTVLADSSALHVNRAFVRTFGYEPEEVATIEAWFAKAYPDEASREQVERDTQEWMAQTARGELPAPREYRVTCKDGRVLDVEVAAAVVAGRFVGTFTDVTPRRRELELRKAREEELQRVLDNLPFPVGTSVAGTDFDWRDPRAQVTFLNRRFTRVFGYTREDIPTIGEWARRALPDEARRHEVFSVLERQVQAALRGEGEVGPVEVAVVCRDGSLRQALIQAVAVGNQMVFSLEDITERERARQRLAESEERFRKMIEQAPVAISFTDNETGLVYMNAAHEVLLGYRQDEGWTRERLAAECFRAGSLDLSQWDELKCEARQHGGNLRRELRLAARDGSEREVEVTSIPLPGVDFNVMIDLTERNRVLREVSASESRLRALFDNAPLGIVRLHVPSGRLWLNKEFTALLGYADDDVPTMDEWMARAYPDEIYRRELLAKWQRDLAEAKAQDGRLAPSEVRVTDKAGREHEMQFSGVILGEEVFGLWTDLTQRNRAERLLRERQEQLARVGRVSTLGQLAASLAHELDQPLGAILNNAEAARLMLAREEPDVQELRAIVEDILADDRRAGAVLDRIRSMVRQRKFESQAVPVETLLREVARLVYPVAAAQGISLEISCEPGTPAIKGDAVLLQQALLNLTLNSMEAIGSRTDGRIEMQAGEGLPGIVEISVGDNGGGVAASEFASLLEPFHTTKRNGLGMGLPLVQSIAEQHGGKLRLANQLGRGLAVYLTLPACEG